MKLMSQNVITMLMLMQAQAVVIIKRANLEISLPLATTLKEARDSYFKMFVSSQNTRINSQSKEKYLIIKSFICP